MGKLLASDSQFRVYLFRHGQTDWNKERRWQGHTDIALNEEGRRQALELIEPLSKASIEVILSSDLSRASETASIVAQVLKVPIVHSVGLRECHLGQAEGRLFEEVVSTWGETFLDRWNSPVDLDFGYPGGETKRQQLNRTLNALQGFLESNKFSRVGISTHGMVIRNMLAFAGDPQSVPTSIPNCSVHAFSFSKLDKTWNVQLLSAK